jgi:hypothetical protein
VRTEADIRTEIFFLMKINLKMKINEPTKLNENQCSDFTIFLSDTWRLESVYRMPHDSLGVVIGNLIDF